MNDKINIVSMKEKLDRLLKLERIQYLPSFNPDEHNSLYFEILGILERNKR